MNIVEGAFEELCELCGRPVEECACDPEENEEENEEEKN